MIRVLIGGIEIPCTLPDDAHLKFDDSRIEVQPLVNGQKLLILRDPVTGVEAHVGLSSLAAKEIGVALTDGHVSAGQAAALLPPGMA